MSVSIHLALDSIRRVDPVDPDGTLLLVLHGRGTDGADLAPLAKELWPRARALCPDAPFRYGPGLAWYDEKDRQPTFLASADALRRLLDEARGRYGITAARTAIVGFSQGGMMTTELLVTLDPSEAPALACVLSGRLNEGTAGRARKDLKGRRAFVAHGTGDEMIPVAEGRQLSAFLTKLGVETTFREYTMGHTISNREAADVRAALQSAWGAKK